MKTRLIREAQYDGMGWQSTVLTTPIEVEVLGIPMPVDPGVIRIRLPSGKEITTAAFALEDTPEFKFSSINWGDMLSPEQIKRREKLGILAYESAPTSLLPIDQAPLH